MSLTTILPFSAAIIMAIFTVSVLQRYVRRRQAYYLFWGVGLTMFALASLGEALLNLGWSSLAFFVWYLFGAFLTAAWIGHGTLLLLVRKKWTLFVTILLLLGSLFAVILMIQVMSRIDPSQYAQGTSISEQYQEILPPKDQGGGIRNATIFFNIYGTLTLVGGALYSSYLYWRKRVLPNRVIGNVLIAVGALSIALAGTLTRLGYGQFLYVSEMIAALLMFVGFRQAAKPQPDEVEGVVPAVAHST